MIVSQNQLLTKGMVILRDKIRFYEGKMSESFIHEGSSVIVCLLSLKTRV